MVIRRLLPFAGLLIALAACQSSPPPPIANSTAVSGVTPEGFRLPDGAGCAGDIARFRAIIDNDLSTGHTTAAVHTRMTAELDRAGGLCSAGNDAEARALVRSTRSRFGYPA